MLFTYPLNITPHSPREKKNGAMAFGRELTLERLRKLNRLLQNMEKQFFVRLHLSFSKFNEFVRVLDCAQERSPICLCRSSPHEKASKLVG